MVHLGQALVGFQEAYYLRKLMFNSATKALPGWVWKRYPSRKGEMEESFRTTVKLHEGCSLQPW
jgi:hypothetical protein